MFDFGSNWEAFSDQRLDEDRISIAVRSLQTLLRRESFAGLSFLDVGCGSGLFSIAAHRMGAARVVGIDINPRCISVSAQNCARLAPHPSITFCQMSALDSDALLGLGVFDVVYAWGSLHHTGAMWDAIRNTAQCVAPGGMLTLAIYNRHMTSPAWRVIKRVYNHLPKLGQRVMAIFFTAIIYVAKFVVTRRNPLNKERGMDFWYDVIDWIGGYPYEYATSEQVRKFVEAQGYVRQHWVAASVPTGCNEFVFTKSALPSA